MVFAVLRHIVLILALFSGVEAWREAPQEHDFLLSTDCDIPKLGPLGWERYLREESTHPVVLVNVTDNSIFREITSRESLLGMRCC